MQKYYSKSNLVYRADLAFHSKMKLVIVNRKTNEVLQGNPDPDAYESHLIRAERQLDSSLLFKFVDIDMACKGNPFFSDIAHERKDKVEFDYFKY